MIKCNWRLCRNLRTIKEMQIYARNAFGVTFDKLACSVLPYRPFNDLLRKVSHDL